MDIQLVREGWQHGWTQLRYIKDDGELAEAAVELLMRATGRFVSAFMQARVLDAYNEGSPERAAQADRRDALATLRAESADVVGAMAVALRMFGDDRPYISITNSAAVKAATFGDFEGLALATGRLTDFAGTEEEGVVPMATMPRPPKARRDNINYGQEAHDGQPLTGPEPS